ncbi:hypothetical protein DY000_02006103 [Brassica cretica]|uniref:Uncharacterized protein n=1 Tax=Brassica cretica TaxID=69181 RepID=A0ABQ7CKS2_BRACR|nr:hypothetical protein DY000_02006103 [Brassica cretica]
MLGELPTFLQLGGESMLAVFLCMLVKQSHAHRGRKVCDEPWCEETHQTRRRQAQQSWTSDSVAGQGNGQARLARGSSMMVTWAVMAAWLDGVVVVLDDQSKGSGLGARLEIDRNMSNWSSWGPVKRQLMAKGCKREEGTFSATTPTPSPLGQLEEMDTRQKEKEKDKEKEMAPGERTPKGILNPGLGRSGSESLAFGRTVHDRFLTLLGRFEDQVSEKKGSGWRIRAGCGGWYQSGPRLPVQTEVVNNKTGEPLEPIIPTEVQVDDVDNQQELRDEDGAKSSHAGARAGLDSGADEMSRP